MSQLDRFERATQRFDEENARDPNLERIGGTAVPCELLYARRLTDWVLKLDPNASEALQLAARSQHIRRWEIPRADFPPDRAGYHQWRTRLKRFHAEISAVILREAGYDQETIARVRALNLKEHFPSDPESQTLEDALCLVFLEHQFADLAAKLSPEKMINALRKTWAKMSEKGRQSALGLRLPAREEALLRQALRTD